MGEYIIDKCRTSNEYFEKYSNLDINHFNNSNSILIEGIDVTISNFVNNSKKGIYRGPKNRKILYIGKVSKNLNDYINSKLNNYKIDLTGFNLTLDSDRIVHIINKHGDEYRESLLGQRAIKQNDFLMIPYIISETDIVEHSVEKNGNNGLKFIKFYENKIYNACYFISSKHKKLTLSTFYIHK